jgi:hypothetical protein
MQVLPGGRQNGKLLINNANKGADDQTGGAGKETDFVINVEGHEVGEGWQVRNEYDSPASHAATKAREERARLGALEWSITSAHGFGD